MLELIVHTNRLGPVRGRHPWVFSGAFKRIPDGIASGAPVKLVDESGKFLAGGYFNSYSQIAARVWGWEENEEVNEEFFIRRIKTATDLRRAYVESKKTDSYRLINSENDLLPGLIVDKYADCLVAQFHNRGIEAWKKEIVAALVKVLKPKGIYERSDVGGRRFVIPPTYVGGIQSPVIPICRRGGEESLSGVLFGKIPERVKIKENGYRFWVDIIGGQKTGFFLDQRDKRAALPKYCQGKNVLNCFSYTGGFSVYALAGGAKFVTNVDTSQAALDLAKANIKLNGFNLKKCEFVCEDVKNYLSQTTATPSTSPLVRGRVDPLLSRRKVGMPLAAAPEEGSARSAGGGGSFDVIILDPPAFIKDRRKIHEGLQGYRKINEAALRLLPAGGILVSASCSQHLSLPDFRFMLSESAGRANRTLQILETFTHGIDHPQLVAFIEGEYLKCVFALVR